MAHSAIHKHQEESHSGFPVLVYSVVAYLIGSGGLVYMILWLAGLAPGAFGVGLEGAGAYVWSLFLILLFGIQHSVMARSWFKEWIQHYIPEAAERSTYVLAAGLMTILVVVLWSPMPEMIWQVQNTLMAGLLWTGFIAGWVLLFAATFMINHFDLFGLRQAWLHFKGEKYRPLEFTIRGLYAKIRHPIMTGLLIGLWCTPVMTKAHLLFAAGMTVYIMVGLYHEEKDLVKHFGERYHQYAREVGALFPKLKKRG